MLARCDDPGDDLGAYLRAAYDQPFVYGRCDCALWVCHWIEIKRGIDPGAEFRGRYSTKIGCARLLKRAGGLLDLTSRAFAKAGLHTIDAFALRPGDVGCLKIETGSGMSLAIYVGHARWAWKGDRSLVMTAECPVLRIWRV